MVIVMLKTTMQNVTMMVETVINQNLEKVSAPIVNVLTKIVPNGNVTVLTQPMNDAESKSCCNV